MRLEYGSRITQFQGKSEASSAIVSLLLGSELYISAAILVGFVPMESEPAILPVLRHWTGLGRKLLLPAFVRHTKSYALAEVKALDGSALVPGKYGILEPREEIPRQQPPYTFSEPAIWLVPGVAFSPGGLRLGRGGGYYDRLLDSSNGVKIAVCFDCQLAEELPATRQDAKMDYILTESCITKCTHAS